MSEIEPPVATPTMGEEAAVMSIFGHLNELRVRLTYAAVALLIATAFSFIFADRMLEFLMQPYSASIEGEAALQTLRPTEGIETFFRVSLLAGVVLAMPVILFEFWQFIRPALSKNEERYIYFFIPAALFLFLLGIAFAWFILAPAAIYFLANFMPDIFRAEWTGQEYISFVTRLLLWIGLAFQMPIVIYVIARVGLVSAITLRQQWRVAVVLVAVLAAVITPSVDPVTMLLTMAPLFALYVLSLGLAVIGERQFARSMAEIESRPAI